MKKAMENFERAKKMTDTQNAEIKKLQGDLDDAEQQASEFEEVLRARCFCDANEMRACAFSVSKEC